MSHRADKLILHIGLAKTGSTAIQNAFFENKDVLLAEAGVLYPGTISNHWHLHSLFSESPGALRQIVELNLKDSLEITEWLREYQASILKEVDHCKPKTIVFSSEWLAGMSIDELILLKEFLEKMAREVICFAFVRHPIEFALSLYQEMLKTGQIADEGGFRYMGSYIEILEKFDTAFDKKVVCEPVVFRDKGINVIELFLNRFLIPIQLNFDKYSQTNTSMPKDVCCVLSQLNLLYPVFDDNGVFKVNATRDWMYEALIHASRSDAKLELSRESAKRISSSARPELLFFQERYLDGRREFSEAYLNVEFRDIDDHCGVSALSARELSKIYLKSLELLSEKALYYYEQMNALLTENAQLRSRSETQDLK